MRRQGASVKGGANRGDRKSAARPRSREVGADVHRSLRTLTFLEIGGGGGNRTHVRVVLVERVYVRIPAFGFSGRGPGRARCHGRESDGFSSAAPRRGLWTSLRSMALSDLSRRRVRQRSRLYLLGRESEVVVGNYVCLATGLTRT
jgi:hypothetical protein